MLIVDLAALRRRARPAVPADLLHVAVELDRVAVGVDRECAVVNAGEELGRQMLDGDAVLPEEGHGVLQLGVAAKLETE